MINYGLEIRGKEAVLARMGGFPGDVMHEVTGALDVWAKETASYIIEVKLSDGNPLNRRSGKLSRSVHGDVEAQGEKVSGIVGAGAGVPYAKIHEYGGLIPAHKVVATNAQALSIPTANGIIFRKSANIPEIHMPERSYVRSGFREKAPSGIQALKDATLRGIKS